MAWTPDMREKYFSDVIARMNELGYEVMRERDESSWAAFKRMKEDYDSLLEKHPDRYAAVGKDGLLAVGDSADEVVREVKARGFHSWEFVLEFLESDPAPQLLWSSANSMAEGVLASGAA